MYETADVLERIGNVPKHRNGASALYGRHLREVVKNTTTTTPTIMDNGSMSQKIGEYMSTATRASGNGNAETLMALEPLLFSAMSDHQIVEAIDNAGGELETFLPPFQIDEQTGSDWLDWFTLDDTSIL